MTFDTMRMVRKFLAADFNRKQAEALTEGIQESQTELVTKTDLEIALANLKVQLLFGNAALLGVAVALIKLL